ncbi:MAG: MarR family winged helix-turn-helix transcriptional regulator [Gammaproteobacteria bacterium]
MTDVPAPHLRLLLLLRERPGLTVGAYAEWLGLHMSTVSNLIRDLHRSGFIERASDPQDRRRTLLKLTAAGEQKSRARVDFIRGLLPALLERLSPTDLRALIRVMSRLLDQAPRRFRRVETPGRS